MKQSKYVILGYNVISSNEYMTHDDQLVLQSLLVLLSTPKKSLPLRPNYGSNLKMLLFEPLSNPQYIKKLAEQYVRDAIAYERRVTLDQLQVLINYDGNSIVVLLSVIINISGARIGVYYPISESPIKETA